MDYRYIPVNGVRLHVATGGPAHAPRAWQLAARHRGLVERLVIINAPYPARSPGYASTHPFQLTRSPYGGFFQLVPEALLSAHGISLLTASLTWTRKPGPFDPELRRARRRHAWRAPRAISSMLYEYRAMSLARPVSTPIKAPTLLLWGGQDTALDAGLADEALGCCARGELERLDDAAHWLHHAQPVRQSALRCRFLARHAATGAPA